MIQVNHLYCAIIPQVQWGFSVFDMEKFSHPHTNYWLNLSEGLRVLKQNPCNFFLLHNDSILN